jgi:hypothetical protein
MSTTLRRAIFTALLALATLANSNGHESADGNAGVVDEATSLIRVDAERAHPLARRNHPTRKSDPPASVGGGGSVW